MPRFAALIYSPAETEGTGTPEEWEQVMAEYNEFGRAAGDRIVGGEALHDTPTARTVRVDTKGGEPIVTDGPFAETEEVLGGFYLLECNDMAEAVHWAAQIPGAWHGRVEVRQVIDFDGGS